MHAVMTRVSGIFFSRAETQSKKMRYIVSDLGLNLLA